MSGCILTNFKQFELWFFKYCFPVLRFHYFIPLYPRFSVHFSVFGRIVLATAATASALNDGRQQDVSYVDSLHIPHKQL